jgi:hypothetical protein
VLCPTPVQQIVLQAYVQTVTEQTERLGRLDLELHEQVHTWRLAPVVEALQALRGVQCTVAVTTVAERGDLTRFENPRQLMNYLGLTPSEYARGGRRQQGGMTKTGNTHARRALVEGAWAYRYPAKGSRHLQLRLEKRPTAIQAISWQAQVRRCTRYRHLMATGKNANHVVVAIARALRAFMGAIAQPVAVRPQAYRRLRVAVNALQGSHVCRKSCSPGVESPSAALRGRKVCSSLEGGRHPTDTRKVGANPRISAGSTVGSSWLRLFR